MDDDLLADDGQFKDDGLDELDIDEEAALLGLSDEEIESERITGDQDLEYVDEDGNPVEIGENNAEQYEVSKYQYDKNRGTPTEDDVLDLDLDAELESFTEEDPDLLRESPVKTFNERQCKDNLISLTSRNERNKPMLKRQDSRRSPERGMARVKTDNSYSTQSTRKVSVESFNLKVEYDEESEDEEDDDHRERFKSERSNIITLTPAKNRDIPDTLESVISVEETAKVQAFLENEQKRKMRYKGGRNTQQMKNPSRHGRPAQSFPGAQHHQPSQFSAPAPAQQQFEMPPGPPQPQKILINPHFRGPRQLPVPEPAVTTNQSPQVPAPQIPYNQPQNFAPPVGYSQDHSHQVSVAPPPTYSAPPLSMHYGHPDYPPQQQQHVHIQQNQPPIWQNPPPEMHPPPVSYANPPPHLNYGEHMGHAPVYHNSYNPNNFQNAAYTPQMPPPQMPPPQNMNYNQPPPIVHHHPPSHSQVGFSAPPPANVPHMHFQNSQPQQNLQQKPYQEQRNVNQGPRNGNQSQRNSNQAQSHNFQRNNAQNQPYNRVPEKRPSNVNMKQVPKKQPRLEHQPRKNVHVNNSNIREIPLVDTVKKEPNVVPVKKEGYRPVVVEEEDEKTKELRMKIEEQKLLREQILKRKEERRRQMAAQRMMDLKKRQQSEQNMNVISVPRVEQKVPVQPPVQAGVKPKVSVRERIGVPGSNTGQVVKKKVVVVRKKAIQPVSNAANTQQNRVGISQRLGNQPMNQGQPQMKPVVNTQAKQTQQTKQTPQAAPTTQPPAMKKNLPQKNWATAAAKKIIAKSKPNAKQPNSSQLKQKGNILQRLGNRGNFRHTPFDRPQQGMRPSPRFNESRPPPPFMEHRMRFPGAMNDMRQPFHDQGPPPFDRRPPPFEDHRLPPFEDNRLLPFEDRRPPPFDDRRPPPFEDRRPPFHDQRPLPFENQRPPLLPFHPPDEPFHHPDERPPFNQFMLENDHPRFRKQGPGYQDFHPMRMDFPDRFPRPQFQNQMMRPKFEQKNGPMFQRPRFHGSNQRQRFNNQQKKTEVVNKTSPGKTAPAPTPAKTAVVVKKEEPQEAIANSQNTSQQVVSNAPSDIKPQSVCVENLSSSTSAMQLKKLCSSVGVIENIQLIKDQRKAVIKFKEPSHAINFQKKFQRYMLDLAMIQVSLITT